MARPKATTEDLSDRIIEEAEKLLIETQGRRLVLSEIAARIGIAQSYTHRFFPTKADLVRALAARWFADVERASRRAAALDAPAAERLEAWVLAVLRLKRARYDENPALFRAYLDLAAGHMDLVREHTDRLRKDLRGILSATVEEARLDEAVALAEDATVLFRTPDNIARRREAATDERAKAVVRMLADRLC